MDGREWFDLVLDPAWELLFDDVVGSDPLGFPGYPEALEQARTKTGESESILVAAAQIDGRPVIALSSVFGFMGGSMGAAHGERVCRAFELATERGLPLVAMTASGGARMQEGMVALSQMPATLQARARHKAAGLGMVAVLRNPTTGGVFASYANAADHMIAIEGATIGFAGPRVAEAFTGEALPEGSHTAANALRHGLVDDVCAPDQTRDRVIAALAAHRGGEPVAVEDRPSVGHATGPLPDEDAWAAVKASRDPKRRESFTQILPPAGRQRIAGREVMVVWTPKQPDAPQIVQDTASFVEASQAGLPLVVFVDLHGADPSAASEEAGVARAISDLMSTAVTSRCPTLAIVLGEGGSGGALAYCAGADTLLMTPGSMFSVIAPEGAASILRRTDVPQVARELRCGPNSLVALGIANALVPDESVEREIVAWLRSDPATTSRTRWRQAVLS